MIKCEIDLELVTSCCLCSRVARYVEIKDYFTFNMRYFCEEHRNLIKSNKG